MKGNLYLNSRNETFDVFDVFNNGYDLGGKLKVFFDRQLTIKNDSVTLTNSKLYPKIIHRKYVNDVALNIGVTVHTI